MSDNETEALPGANNLSTEEPNAPEINENAEIEADSPEVPTSKKSELEETLPEETVQADDKPEEGSTLKEPEIKIDSTVDEQTSKLSENAEETVPEKTEENKAEIDKSEEVTKAEEKSISNQPLEEKASKEETTEQQKSENKIEESEEIPHSENDQIMETEAIVSEKKSFTIKESEEKTSKISIGEKKSSLMEKKISTVKSDALSVESLSRKTRSFIKGADSKETRRISRVGSRAQKILGSTISIRRMSATGEFYDKSKVARYMNTYKLDSDNPFNSEKVQKILESVMIEALENLTYDPDKCPKQAKWASSAIRAKVKELQFDRYKLICLVTIGEKNSQDILVTCRFLWDVDRDRYASYSIENTYVFGIAMCFGLYYE